MFRLFVLSVLVACAYSHENIKCCSIEDRKEVLNLWESVWSAEYTGRRVAIAIEVFKKMFEIDPDTKAMFTGVNVDDMNSAEFRAHVIRVTNGFDTAINLAFDSNTLHKELDHLKVQHTKYAGLRQAYFDDMRKAFTDVLPQAIPCFNAAAWNRCVRYMQSHIYEGLPA